MRGDRYVIVHVDDSPTALALVKSALEDSGFEVHSAADAQDLEQRLMVDEQLRKVVDLFVLDMEMPDLMGAQVGAVMTEVYEELAEVPFVIYSGKEREWVEKMSAEVAEISNGFGKNFKGYMLKDEGSEEKLAAMIRSILGGGK